MKFKDLKTEAKKSLRKHYGFFVILCLIAALIGTSYSEAISVIVDRNDYSSMSLPNMKSSLYVNLFDQSFLNKEVTHKKLENEKLKNKKIGRIELGRQDGFLSAAINQISSGALLLTVYTTIHQIVGSHNITLIIMILIAGIIYLLFVIFIVNTFSVVYKRLFLEGITYEELPINRLYFLARVKKWVHVSLAMFKTSLYSVLWGLTIIGGFIKHYSYFLVPYILAENPSLTGSEAINLSRKMMKGNKRKVFLLDLSLIGWKILGYLTFGILDILFVLPYQEAIYAQVYKELRGEGNIYLNDKYLFEKANNSLLQSVYNDVKDDDENEEVPKKTLGSIFGISYKNNTCDQFVDERSKNKEMNKALKGLIYPRRLHPLMESERISSITHLQYMRTYSILSLIVIFFTMSIMGWMWEVILHLLTNGEIVNRGFLHGPYLPIYGVGGVLMLTVLYRFRSSPFIHFGASIILCGIVEYYASLVLEILNNGQKWWNYNGYFFNIDGRISAEGLIFFGIGGLIIVYVVAPLIDQIVKQCPKRLLKIIVTILLITYSVDIIYSIFNPNTGKGVVSQSAIYIQGDKKC